VQNTRLQDYKPRCTSEIVRTMEAGPVRLTTSGCHFSKTGYSFSRPSKPSPRYKYFIMMSHLHVGNTGGRR
jgi:hypothetical protein